MIVHARLGARLLAGALVFSLLPTLVLAQEAAPRPHPWKLALAKRMAEERMEHKEHREQREEGLRRLARELKKGKKSSIHGRGESVRPARPDDILPPAGEPTATPRGTRSFAVEAFTTPANHIVNNRAGDAADAGQSETAIVAVGDKLVAAWNDGQGFQTFGDTQGWATSADGGQTWTDQGNLPHATGVTGFQWTSDPVLTVNEKTGAVYYAGLCDFNDANGSRSGVAIAKGRWTGATFNWEKVSIARGVSAVSDFIDKEWIVADSVSSRVFLTYSRFPTGLSVIEFQSVDSALTTFSSPVRISLNNTEENGFVQASRPIVDGDGTLFVMYYLIGQGEADFYRVARSDNGGVSFTTPVTAESLYTNFGTGAPGFNRPLGIQFAGIAVDRSHGPNRGRLYLSWAESIDWLDDVFSVGFAGDKSEIEGNDTPQNATPMTVGQTARGTVSSITDIDLFSLPLLAGQSVIAAADSMQSGGELSLRLLASDGVTRLAFTSFDATVNSTPQNPQGTPSGWMFTAPADGTYYLRLASRIGTGSYRVRVGLADVGAERGRDQRDVFVAWSDGGTSWSQPVRLSEDAVGFDAFVPELAVAPDGGVYCAWFDYRDAPAATNGGHASVYLARSGDGGATWTTLGAVSDTLSNWSSTPSNIEPNQGDYLALFANASSVWPCWSDARRGNPDVFTSQVALIPNGAQVTFQALRLGYRRVSMDWRATPADTLTMRLYRAQDGGAYSQIDVVTFDALGELSYTDTTVVGEHAYSYRLGRFTNGVELFYGQVRLFLPDAFPLAMSAPRPNPVVGNSFTVNLALTGDGPADLLLHDISGREVFRQTVSLGKGPHTLTLPVGSGLKQGLYILTLRQGGHNASTRVHLVR